MRLPRLANPLIRLAGGPLAATLAVWLAACGGSSTPAPPVCTGAKVVTATGAYTRFAAADWDAACGALTVSAPALASDERLAVVLVNGSATVAGPDNATPSLDLSGTQAFVADAGPAPLLALAAEPYPGPAPLLPPDRAALQAGHDRAHARGAAAVEAWLAAGSPPAASLAAPADRLLATAAVAPVVGQAAPNGGFCVFSDSTKTYSRLPATVRWTTANAVFYVTDEAWGRMNRAGGVLAQRPDLFATLESYFEGTVSARNPAPVKYQVQPSLRANFGTETDVDGNGKVLFLMANLGKDPGSGGFAVGYFDATDVVVAADTSSGCTGNQSNGADMLYLLDPDTFNANNFPLSTIIDQEMPGTMAHELQHNVIFNTRCKPPSGAGQLASCAALTQNAGDLWLNEGLSMASEDLAGFGLNGQSERDRDKVYLNCQKPSSTALCYQDVSLTTWPAAGGNPFGHYGGSHLFLRWHLDQANAGHAVVANASAFTRAVVASPQLSRAAIKAASGLDFDEGFLRFAAGSLFSGEANSPVPTYGYAAGVPWSPLHATVGFVAYTSLPRPQNATLLTTLRNDGWGAYVTGTGTGASATLTVSSTASVKPSVAVLRFRGAVP